MSTTQTIRQEEIELRTPGPTPSSSKNFDFATPATSTTRLQSSRRTSESRPQESRSTSTSPERGPDQEPQEGAVEVAPEGGYGWVVVGACSVAM
jgi:hypothetical protein